MEGSVLDNLGDDQPSKDYNGEDAPANTAPITFAFPVDSALPRDCPARPLSRTIDGRVVAAGIEQNQVDPGAGLFHLVEDTSGTDRLRKNVALIERMGVDRDQVVEAMRL
jgi:hypothetical protein